jgi:hypothetical protein
MSYNGPKREFTPLEAGEYMVIVDDKGFRGEKENKKGTGINLSLAFKVISGPSANRLIFDNFCVEHENKVAVEIANRRLDEYLKAVGLSDGLDALNGDRTLLENYINKPLNVDITIEDAKNGYPASNRIAAFKTL